MNLKVNISIDDDTDIEDIQNQIIHEAAIQMLNEVMRNQDHIDEALRKFDNISIKFDYGSANPTYDKGSIMRNLERYYDAEAIGKILLAESTKKDKPDNRLLW